MKTTVIISCLFAGSMIVNTQHPVNTSAPLTKTVKSRRALSKTLPIAPVQIIIDKSNYELYVYDKEGWFATYPVVFGNSSLDDKKMEGDRNTPEGSFKIANKRVHEKWDRYMGLDYPTKESLEKFRQRKQRGEIPANATPGGGVGIHGTWPHEDYIIDRYQNWTNGCISLKNEDVEDLYSYIPIGTPVTIRK
jgi:lipoprotein-anchoring transpeptidase ErfK/SrfK